LHNYKTGEGVSSFKRIDPISPRQNFESLCEIYRRVKECDEKCMLFDIKKTHSLFDAYKRGEDILFESYECHNGLIDFMGPIFMADRMLAVIFSGQLISEGINRDKLANEFIHKVAQFYSDNQNIDKLSHEIKESVNRLTTPDLFIAELKKTLPPTRVDQSASFKDVLEKAAKEIGGLVESEWRNQKRTIEDSFLDNTIQMFYEGNSPGTRNDVQNKTEQVLGKVKEYCSLEYVALFASEPERISIKGNENVIPLFAHSGLRKEQAAGLLHLNWRKAKLPSILKTMVGQNGNHHYGSCFFLSQEYNKDIVEKGLKGPSSNFFVNATVLLPVFLSPRYRGAILLGPFRHLKADDITREEPFLRQLSMIAVVVLSQLHMIDFDAVSKLDFCHF